MPAAPTLTAYASVPHLLAAAAVAAVVGGLAAVERKGALQLMLSRPLVLGPLLGWALGDAQGGLTLGVPLELLFLGGVNLGGSIPLNETLLVSALIAALVPAGAMSGKGVDPALAALGLALLFPLATAGRRLERASELRNSALLEAALARAEAGDPDAAQLNLRGLFAPFAWAGSICAACALVSPLFAALRLSSPARLVTGLEGAWHAALALAVAAALRAIRDRRAPLIAGLTTLAVGIAAILAGVLR